MAPSLTQDKKIYLGNFLFYNLIIRIRYINPQKESISKRFKKNIELPNNLKLNINSTLDSGTVPNSRTNFDRIEEKRFQNKSMMVEVGEISSKIKQNSATNLLNQRAKQTQQYDQNLHVNRDASDDNPLHGGSKRKKIEVLRNFTHSVSK